MCATVAVIDAFPLMLHAQGIREVEAGAGVGITRISGDDIAPQAVWHVGLFFKARVGAPELEIDYERIDRRLAVLHAVSGGWLIRGTPKTVRPFFQFGATVARQNPGTLVAARTLFGPSLAGGVAGSIGEHVVIRPELRWKFLLPGPMMLVQPSVGIGWRF
jgi:hypothetical protein